MPLHCFHMHSLLISFKIIVAHSHEWTNLMDNVSQLFAVGEYGLVDGGFSQLKKLISERTTTSPIRNWVLRFNHTSVVIRL